MKAIFSCLFAFLLLSACNKSESVSIVCSETIPSFSTDVNPIIQSSCVSCHSNSNSRGGVALNGYANVYSNRSATRSIFASSSTHQGVAIGSAQRNTVCCWIDNGAPNK